MASRDAGKTKTPTPRKDLHEGRRRDALRLTNEMSPCPQIQNDFQRCRASGNFTQNIGERSLALGIWSACKVLSWNNRKCLLLPRVCKLFLIRTFQEAQQGIFWGHPKVLPPPQKVLICKGGGGEEIEQWHFVTQEVIVLLYYCPATSFLSFLVPPPSNPSMMAIAAAVASY